MLFRGLIFLAGLATLSAAGAWFAKNPGEVSILWRGYRIETSVGVLLLGVGLLAAAVAILYRIWGGFWNMPRHLGRARRDRRGRRGYLALARGMVAVAAGDTQEARRQARRADELLDEPPLTLLLAAQAAQLEGDEPRARANFRAMLERPETEFVGVRGLLMLAQREGDSEAALDLARRAKKLNPRLPWVLDTLFDLQVAAGLWDEAEGTLRAASRQKTLPAAEAKRRTAVVLLQRSVDAEMNEETADALAFARRARTADPGFLPATLRLAWLQHGEGQGRRARKLIEEIWATTPHPELARIYRLAAPSDDPLRALKVLERLEAIRPGDREIHMAMARCALDARLWGETRRHLAAVGEPLTAGFCRLCAELAEAESGDAATAREWLARAGEADPDPAWVCAACGAIAEDWSARCGHCGAFDRLDWRTPPRVRALAPGEASAAIGTFDGAVLPAPPPPPDHPTAPAASPLTMPVGPPVDYAPDHPGGPPVAADEDAEEALPEDGTEAEPGQDDRPGIVTISRTERD